MLETFACARKETLVACVLTGMLAATSAASSSPDDTVDRIAALEMEVLRLRQQIGTDWLTEARAQEIRTLVHDVLADADTRASLLGTGMNAGWDEGFFIGSADGNFRLRVGGNIQFRYVFNHQNGSPVDNNRGGFENTRTQLIFTGHVVNPNWVYRVQGNFSRTNGTFNLEDAYIGYVFGNGWTFLAGQFRVPMLREFLVVEPHQQAVSRSLVHQEFTAGRTQGVALDYRGERFHFTGGFTDGHPATGGFNAPALMRDTEFSLTARLQGLLAGNWNQFADFASWRGDEFGALLGGAVHYQKGEYGTIHNELEVLQWTVDLSLQFGGFNIFAYVVGRHLDAPGMSLDQFGAVVQGGLFITDDWEVFARYEWGDDDMTSPNLSVITVGANRFFARHRIKWSTDVGFGLKRVASTWGDGFIGSGGDLVGWRTDAPSKKGQVVVRTQLQLLF
ncbi:MAG TPA: porin [Phycisphaerales bacterium]|nr:porin [Phycisphaerales bacterium]HRQ74353.1 porin [Phycisphaerales bacterium]